MEGTSSRTAGRRRALATLMLWAALFVGSFVAFALTPARDMGFTAGLNRVTVFLGWQLAAGAVGMVALTMRRRFRRGTLMRRFMLVPATVFLALTAGLVALVLWASLAQACQ